MMSVMAVDEDSLRDLSRADVVAFGPIAPDGMVLPVTRAYERLADLVTGGTVDVRPHLDRLLAEGSPAGRAYAATLLARLDPDAGRSIWRSLVADQAELTTFDGSLMRRTTLAAYAAAQLSRSDEVPAG